MIRLLCIALVCALASGCAWMKTVDKKVTRLSSPVETSAIPDPQRTEVVEALGRGVVRGTAGFASVEDSALLEQVNLAATHFYRTHESPYYRGLDRGHEDANWPEDLPQVCVALSGGGIRSAMFSIGVLKGLDADLHEEIDLVSSVSGGSYANLWLIGGGLDKTPDPFSRERLDRLARTPFLTWADYTASFTGSIIFAVPSLALDYVVFPRDSRPRSRYGHYGYEGSIKRFFRGKGKRRGLRFVSLRARLAEDPDIFPYPVINSTLTPGATGCNDHQDTLSWLDSIFEMTPLRFGSDGYGFNNGEMMTYLPLNQAVGVSGAASDKPAAWWCKVRAALGVRLGAAVPAYSGAHRFREGEDTSGPADINEPLPRLSLSDGGFADNLGVFSAVKRLCATIVVVDGAADPALTFPALHKLEERLEDELNVELQAPELKEVAEGNRERVDGLYRALDDDKLKKKAEAKRGNRLPWTERAVHKALAKAGQPLFVADAAVLPEGMTVPVFTGKIGPFPYPGQKEPLWLKVVYVKLAMTAEMARSEHETLEPVVDHLPNRKRQACESGIGGVKCPFPQMPTSKQAYTPEQVRAYIALGEYLGLEVSRLLRARFDSFEEALNDR